MGTEASLDVVDEEQPEFARFKLKKTNTIKSASSVDTEDVGSTELKKKLARQKSVADGIGIFKTKFYFSHGLYFTLKFFKFHEQIFLCQESQDKVRNLKIFMSGISDLVINQNCFLF